MDATQTQLGFIPNMHRVLSLSPAVLSGWNDLQTALGRTLDATTRHDIAQAVTEVNGCHYCKAVHTLAVQFSMTSFSGDVTCLFNGDA